MLELIAHRGFSGIAPENTLPAFALAAHYGFHSLECDVQITADGIPVVIHDEYVNRTTNGSGRVKELTLAQLRALDAGSWKAASYTGITIPTLNEYLAVCRDQSYIIYPELKGYRTPADIPLVVKPIIEQGFEHNCVLQSFTHSDFEVVRRLSKKIILGYLVEDELTYRTALQQAAADGNAVMLPDYRLILSNPTLVEQSRKLGVDLAVWTITDPEDKLSLQQLGVKRFMQNHLLDFRR